MVPSRIAEALLERPIVYRLWQAPFVRAKLAPVLAECDLSRVRRVLDLGCGQVPLFGVYRNYATEVICIDWENTPHRSEHLDHVCDLGGRLPLSDGEFNTIILSDVLEHIPQPENLWREMARISADKAIVMMNTP